MTTSASGPVSIKGTSSGASLSVLKSISDLDSFMSASSEKELNNKFISMIKEFQTAAGSSGKNASSSTMNKTQRGFSLSQILAQSLQNGDKQMLEAALCVSSAQHAKVLQVSLMRLPAAMVVPLLEAITKRLTLKPRRAMHLLPWLKNLLLCHAGYLSTIPSAAKMLAPLQQSIEERMASMAPMQKLAGRLELLLKQAELRELARATDASAEDVSEEPLAVYDESESELETESENEYNASDKSDEDNDEENGSEMDVSEAEDQSEDNEEDEEEDFDDDEDDDDSYEDEDAEDDFE